MEGKIYELYDHGEVAALKKKLRVRRIIAAAIGAAALAVCVLLCIGVNSANAKARYLGALISSVAGGWAVITLRCFVIADIKNEIKHCEAMLDGIREKFEGNFRLTDELMFVRNGVAIRRIEAEHGMQKEPLRIFDKKARLFNENAVCVYTVYGFITAYEV